jgi:hypothetical protein
MRLDWLIKYSLFTAHGRSDVRTPVHAWGALTGGIARCVVEDKLNGGPKLLIVE